MFGLASLIGAFETGIIAVIAFILLFTVPLFLIGLPVFVVKLLRSHKTNGKFRTKEIAKETYF